MTSRQDVNGAAIDVSGARPEAREIYRQVAVILRDHLGPDLVSLVAHGSAVKGGLILGSSDIDYMLFVEPGCLTPGGELPLARSIAIHRDLAGIAIAPFRYLQGAIYPVGSGPETGFVPGAYQVVTGSPDIPIATNDALLAAARKSLERRDPAATFDWVSNGLLDHGETRLSRMVRGLCTDVWPTMFQVAALSLGDGVRAWQLTKPKAAALLDGDPLIGPPLADWMQAITRHYGCGETVDTALEALQAGCAFLDAAGAWYRGRDRSETT